MGATTGPGGTARAQSNLRALLFALNMEPVNRPEFKLSQAGTMFDEEGKLTDPSSVQFMQQLVDNLALKVERHHQYKS